MSLLYRVRALKTFYISCCLCAMILIFNSLKQGGWLDSAKKFHDFNVLFWLIFHANFLWCITWNSFRKYISLLNRVGARALRTFYLSCCLCAMILIFNSLKRGGWLHSAKSCHDFYVLFWLIFHANFLWWCKDFEKKFRKKSQAKPRKLDSHCLMVSWMHTLHKTLLWMNVPLKDQIRLSVTICRVNYAKARTKI